MLLIKAFTISLEDLIKVVNPIGKVHIKDRTATVVLTLSDEITNELRSTGVFDNLSNTPDGGSIISSMETRKNV
jgi:hypothetical protein